MSEENYMDQFDDPEDFIRHQLLANGYCSDTLTKKEMYHLIKDNNIEFQLNKGVIEYTKKKDMLDALLTKLSYRDLADYVGVLRKSFCMKFNITIDEFNILVANDLIHKSGSFITVRNPYKTNATWSKWCWYNVYDYFELTDEIIHRSLN